MRLPQAKTWRGLLLADTMAAVVYWFAVSAEDHWRDDDTWGEALGSNVLGAALYGVGMFILFTLASRRSKRGKQ